MPFWFSELIQCPQGLDLAFMIDANQSISDFDFERQKDFVKRVVKTLIEKRIRLNAAAVSYSDDAFVSLTLNFSQTFSVNSFNFIIDRLRRLPDKTLASKALQFTKDHVLKPALSGPTSHTPKIAFGVTTRKNLGETFELSIGRSSIRRNRSFQIFNISLPSGAYISSFYMELFLNHLISAIGKHEIKSFCFSLILPLLLSPFCFYSCVVCIYANQTMKNNKKTQQLRDPAYVFLF